MKCLHSHLLRAVLSSCFAFALLAAAPPCLSQQKQAEQPVACGLSRVELVLLTATVTDKRDRPVTTLTHDAFTVFEDNVPRTIDFWQNCSKADCPMSLAILLDLSGSLKVNPLTDEVRSSLARFMKEIGAKEYTLLGFSDTVQLLTDWTHEPDAIVDGLNRATRLKGATALFDALYTATEKIKQREGLRRVLLLITDGQDTNSHYTERQVFQLLRETGVMVYGIHLGGNDPNFLSYGPALLRSMSALTGGVTYFPRMAEDVRKAFDLITDDLRHQYIVGYYPINTKHDGKWRRVKVSVKQVAVNDPANPSQPFQLKDLKVRTREGYYAPNDTSPNPPRR